MEKYLIGVDVGSHSVRAALVDIRGNVKSISVRPIQVLNLRKDFYEQSSDEIWSACCSVCKDVTSSIKKPAVCGIGFDATCSLVVLDKNFNPLSVSFTNDNKYNVIMWMDHRARDQAEFINKTRHSSLKFVGGRISLEMQLPKLLWLKQNFSSLWWESVGHLMDLGDYLTWRATKSLTRSLCSVVCKWLYSPETGWDHSLWRKIGLESLIQDNCAKIGQEMGYPGEPCGNGLTVEASEELGLSPGLPVGVSIIDAYAGTLGLLSCSPEIDIHLKDDITSKFVLICGTSTCHMAVSQIPIFVPGVWGPYLSVMIPNMWINEGGQSATGKLIDHIIETHPAFIKRSPESNMNIHEELFSILRQMQTDQKHINIARLTADIHVWPDFHGNRSPLADPTLKGMISGLTLDSSMKGLSLLYLATIQALAYSTRHVLTSMKVAGHSFDCILMCGGLTKNELYVSTHADVTGLPVVIPEEPYSVLVGSAMLGAMASGHFSSWEKTMKALGSRGRVVFPEERIKTYHECKYEVFLKMLSDQREYRKLMSNEK